jgi:hypothetical protein
MIVQERSEFLRLCLAKMPGWHTCEEGCHVLCAVCEHPERVQRMSNQELADYIERWNHGPELYTREELRQRFIERFGE